MPAAPQGQESSLLLCASPQATRHQGSPCSLALPQTAAGHWSLSAWVQNLMAHCPGPSQADTMVCFSNSFNNRGDIGWKQIDILHPQIPGAQPNTNTSSSGGLTLGEGMVCCPQWPHIPGHPRETGELMMRSWACLAVQTEVLLLIIPLSFSILNLCRGRWLPKTPSCAQTLPTPWTLTKVRSTEGFCEVSTLAI